jgi:hypothetical protein
MPAQVKRVLPMPVSGRWIDAERTVFSVTFSDPWTFDDFVVFDEATIAEMEALEHPVDTIVDVSGTRLTPDRMFLMGTRIRTRQARNHRMMVIVGLDAVLRALMSMGVRTNPQVRLHVVTARTHDEAVRAIARFRERLPAEHERAR